jgi:hypothetical protein
MAELNLMEKPETSELQARASVYAKPRTTVLIKLFAMAPIKGLPQVRRDEASIRAKQQAEAEARGLEFQAYRERGDTGHCWLEKKANVTIRGFVDQLKEIGLPFVGGHFHQQPGKGPVTTLQFSNEAEPQKLPEHVYKLLEGADFNHGTVWCNLKYRDPANPAAGQYRLDTINLAKPKSTNTGWNIKIKGNTYELV